MRKWKNILLLLIAALFVLPVQALAVKPIDLDRPVSLTIEYDWDGTQFDLYRVADVDASVSFTLCNDFTAYGTIDWANEQHWDDLAVSLAEYASKKTPLQSGMVAHLSCPFIDLTAGMYLVVGHEITVGDITYTCKPFLVALPEYEDGDTWNYNVSAYPKYGSSEMTPDPPTPTPPPPTPPPTPPPHHLPQTGQLWWPVPVLLCCGLVSVVIGVLRRKGGNHE